MSLRGADDLGLGLTHHNINASLDDVADFDYSAQIQELPVSQHLERSSNIEQAIVVIVG